LYSQLNYGGTYFGHQNKRIYGYVEYSIYRLVNTHLKEKYNEKQKGLFIKSLEDVINQKVKSDKSLSPNEQKEIIEDLNKIVVKINKLITNHFYLDNSRKFNSNYYW
jgi:hypothetical protein